VPSHQVGSGQYRQILALTAGILFLGLVADPEETHEVWYGMLPTLGIFDLSRLTDTERLNYAEKRAKIPIIRQNLTLIYELPDIFNRNTSIRALSRHPMTRWISVTGDDSCELAGKRLNNKHPRWGRIWQ
jgi:hypothetical protein